MAQLLGLPIHQLLPLAYLHTQEKDFLLQAVDAGLLRLMGTHKGILRRHQAQLLNVDSPRLGWRRRLAVSFEAGRPGDGYPVMSGYELVPSREEEVE